LNFGRKFKSLTNKEKIPLKKAGITGRVQDPRLCHAQRGGQCPLISSKFAEGANLIV
jgi:hypothetical protein